MLLHCTSTWESKTSNSSIQNSVQTKFLVSLLLQHCICKSLVATVLCLENLLSKQKWDLAYHTNRSKWLTKPNNVCILKDEVVTTFDINVSDKI